MRENLSEIEKIELLRPVGEGRKKDKNGIPIMHPVTMDMLDIEHLISINIQSLSLKRNNSLYLVFMFRNDCDIHKYWLHPVKPVPLLQTVACVAVPDFSVDPHMDYEELRHMVYQGRWLGCFWQERGITALPTLVWAMPDTYDICFDSVPKHSVVVLSTIGVHKNPSVFMAGYDEMMKRVQPELIIVYGDMIDGMWGRFINFSYSSCFSINKHSQQIKLDIEGNRIFEIRRCSNGQSRIIC